VGWKVADLEICWAETIAMELALLWMVQQGSTMQKLSFMVTTQGTGCPQKRQVMKHCLHLSIHQMARMMVPSNILLNPMHVTSEVNLVEACSGGKFGLLRGTYQCSLHCLQPLPPHLECIEKPTMFQHWRVPVPLAQGSKVLHLLCHSLVLSENLENQKIKKHYVTFPFLSSCPQL